MASKSGNSKSRDTRPARERYWTRCRLMERKIANLMKHRDMTAMEAKVFWQKARGGRRMKDPTKRMSIYAKIS